MQKKHIFEKILRQYFRALEIGVLLCSYVYLIRLLALPLSSYSSLILISYQYLENALPPKTKLPSTLLNSV